MEYPKPSNLIDAATARDIATRNANHDRMWDSRGMATSAEVESWPSDCQVTNEERSLLEVYEFVNDPPPERYFLYISNDHKRATTWTGDLLGTVVTGAPWRSNLGDKRIPITVYAVNGKTYYGTFYTGAGDYARVKRAKG